MITIKNLSYSYPFAQKHAIENISLNIKEGECVLITGESGCGKSTLLRVINGLAPKYFKGDISGEVTIDGVDTNSISLTDLSSKVATVLQDPEQQFFTLNVKNELEFSMECNSGEQVYTIEDLTELFSLEKIINGSIFDLSEGEKQKVALASSILTGSKIIVLDEPSANLDYNSTNLLKEQLQRLKSLGFTIVLVEHKIYWSRGLADSYYLFFNGILTKYDSIDALTEDGLEKGAELRSPVVDRDIFTNLKNEVSESSDLALEINNLNFAYKKKRKIFEDFSLKIGKGKIISITGKNGRGKTTLAKILTGILKSSSGEIKIGGVARKRRELKKFCTLVTQASDHQLYMKSVKDEIGLAQKMVKSEIFFTQEKLLEMFNLKHLEDRHPQTLSGGEKQRLTILCSIAIKPDILILDEPTSGLDGKNLNRLVKILKQITEKGVTILLITHDAELISNCCTGNINLDD